MKGELLQTETSRSFEEHAQMIPPTIEYNLNHEFM